MADKNEPENAGKSALSREDRLKAALKANLARRKMQRRLREQGTVAQKDTPDDTGQDKDA